jgi:predicted amidophosphoribosyltransferase
MNDEAPDFDVAESAPEFDVAATMRAAPNFDCPRCGRATGEASGICLDCQKQLTPELADGWKAGEHIKASHRAIILGYCVDHARHIMQGKSLGREQGTEEIARFCERLIYRPIAMFSAKELDAIIDEAVAKASGFLE